MVAIRDGFGAFGIGAPADRTLSRPGSVLLESFRAMSREGLRYYTVSATDGGFQFQSRASANLNERAEIKSHVQGGLSQLRQEVAAQIETIQRGWTQSPSSQIDAIVPLDVLIALRSVITQSNSTPSSN